MPTHMPMQSNITVNSHSLRYMVTVSDVKKTNNNYIQ